MYLKDDDNEKIRKVFKNINFRVDNHTGGPKQLRYDLYENISEDTKKELLEIIRIKSDEDFKLQSRFTHLHYEENISC